MAELSAVLTLKGAISLSGDKLQGSISADGTLSGLIGKSPLTVPNYEGEYEIRPDQEEHVMPTKGRLMHKDMTIHEIPYQEVSNNSGGVTVTIGGY